VVEIVGLTERVGYACHAGVASSNLVGPANFFNLFSALISISVYAMDDRAGIRRDHI